MTGIVERLRQSAGEFWAHRYEADVLLIDAADEIERLRTELAAMYELQRSVIDRQSDEIERLRAALLEAHVILQTWVNVSDDMSADPLPKPLREIQDDEQALLIRAQEWCRRVGPVTPVEASRFRTAADEIERLRDPKSLADGLIDYIRAPHTYEWLVERIRTIQGR